MKRLSVGSPEDDGKKPLPAESKTLAKFPRMCEFLTAVAYEDGTKRQPGYLWLKSDAVAFVVTLFDEDACCRLPCRGATLDEALALAEKLLGVENAPWEVDQYMRERKKKKGKK